MTYKEIATMVASAGLPYAYYQFPEGTAQKPPFICYFYTTSDDLYADGTNYQSIRVLNVELYTAEKDFEKEAALEKIFNDNGLTYYKEENYIDSESMWQIAYEMEVIING